MASDTWLFPLWNPLYLIFKLFMWDWYRWLDLFVPVSSGELLVRSLENVSYPCSLSLSEKLCMSSFITINPKYHRNLRRFFWAEKNDLFIFYIFIVMIWHKIKGTLTLQFILLPEFSLFFWDRAVLCFAWDNSRAHGDFWGLQLVTACWSSVSINMVLLWGTSLGEGRSQTKPFLAFTMSFPKSHAAAAGTLGLFFPVAASSGRSLQSPHPQKTWM